MESSLPAGFRLKNISLNVGGINSTDARIMNMYIYIMFVKTIVSSNINMHVQIDIFYCVYKHVYTFL